MNNMTPEQTTNQEEPTAIWNRTFISVFVTNAAFNMGFLMSNALLAIYAQYLGASVTAIGMLIGINSITSILFRLIAGPIMDTYNRKYIVMISTLLMAIAFFGFSISTTMTLLMTFRLIQGVAMAFGNACCLAMVAGAVPREKYNAGIGYYSIAQVVAQALGPALGLAIVGTADFRLTFIIAACVMLGATLFATQISLKFKRTKKLKLTFDNIIAKEALLPAFLMFLTHGASVITTSLLVLHADYRNITANVGLFFTVVAITMVITRPIIGKLTDKFGLVMVVVPALFCNVIAFFVISYSYSIITLLFAAFISAFGHGACAPAIQALSMKAVPHDRRGAASSTNFIGMDLGSLVGPWSAGSIADSLGYAPMWRIMTLPFAAAAFVMVIFRKIIVRIENNFARDNVTKAKN